MDFFDYLRKIFVGHDHLNPNSHHRNDFRNPIWQNDEDDDDDEDGDFRNQHWFKKRKNIYDERDIFDIGPIFIPSEIFNFFTESMNKSMKNLIDNFPEGTVTFDLLDPNFNNIPQIESPQQNLRDNFLKRDVSPLDPPEPKQDISLDGKITAENFSNLWKKSETPIDGESFSRKPQIRTCIRSVTSQVISGPNGREERKTVTDCEGNVTTTIKKQTGDKIQTVTITKDKNGIETRNEDLVEADQNQPLILKDKPNPNIDFPSEPHDNFPWHKYFGPKL